MELTEFKRRARLIKNPMAWVLLREDMRKAGCSEADILEVNHCINKTDSSNIIESLLMTIDLPVVETGASLIDVSIEDVPHVVTVNSTMPLKVRVPKELIS